jgi:hypothetical protein
MAQLTGAQFPWFLMSISQQNNLMLELQKVKAS